MRFAPILLATGIAAYMVPTGAPDGVYTVEMSPEGAEVHQLINGTAANGPYDFKRGVSLTSSAKFRTKRDNTGPNYVTCGSTTLDSRSTDDANNNLDAQCGGGAFVGDGLTYYAKFGSTVAFYCNYKKGSNNCYASERQAASASITQSCGWYTAGYDNVIDRSDTYGYQNVNICFCHC